MLCLYFQGWADLDEWTAHLEELRQGQKTQQAAARPRTRPSGRVASRCALPGPNFPLAVTTPLPLLQETASASRKPRTAILEPNRRGMSPFWALPLPRHSARLSGAGVFARLVMCSMTNARATTRDQAAACGSRGEGAASVGS